MKLLVAIFGMALSFWGADASENQSDPTSPAAIPSDVVQDSNGGGEECLDQTEHAEQVEEAEQVEMFAPEPPGLTCAEMGWYDAGDAEACSCECGHACVKKQWCGTGWCQPWPNYCWKCS
jgi:hypothetical protein